MTREQYIKELVKKPCSVLFKKADGSLRKMHCTLQEDLIPDDQKTTNRTREVNAETVVVWDLEKSAWRSFRVDSVQDIQ